MFLVGGGTGSNRECVRVGTIDLFFAPEAYVFSGLACVARGFKCRSVRFSGVAFLDWVFGGTNESGGSARTSRH